MGHSFCCIYFEQKEKFAIKSEIKFKNKEINTNLDNKEIKYIQNSNTNKKKEYDNNKSTDFSPKNTKKRVKNIVFSFKKYRVITLLTF